MGTVVLFCCENLIKPETRAGRVQLQVCIICMYVCRAARAVIRACGQPK